MNRYLLGLSNKNTRNLLKKILSENILKSVITLFESYSEHLQTDIPNSRDAKEAWKCNECLLRQNTIVCVFAMGECYNVSLIEDQKIKNVFDILMTESKLSWGSVEILIALLSNISSKLQKDESKLCKEVFSFLKHALSGSHTKLHNSDSRLQFLYKNLMEPTKQPNHQVLAIEPIPRKLIDKKPASEYGRVFQNHTII